jgi:hypothetical protein
MTAEFFYGAPIVLRLPGIAQPELPPTGNGYIYFDLASGKLRASNNGAPYQDIVVGAGGGATLQTAYDGGPTIALDANGPVVLTKAAVDATDALDVTVSGGSGAAINRQGFDVWRGVAAPSNSAAGTGRIYFDSGTNTFMASENGGAYVPLIGGGASSLQGAYNGGNTIVLAGALPVAISNPAASATAVVTLTQGTAGQNVLTASGGNISLTGGNFVVGATSLADGTLARSAAALNVTATAGSLNLTAGGANSVVFATNGANQWSVDSSGALLNLNGTPNNIGSATVGQRPANVYVGSQVIVGTTITIDGIANTIVGSTSLSLSSTTGNASLSTSSGNVVLNASAAIDMQIGGTSFWQVGSAGNLLASTDAAKNIGASGANRPNNAFVANSVVVGAAATAATLTETSLVRTGAFSVQATGAAADLTLAARGASTTLNQAGQTALDAAYTGAGFTSLVGALNALVTGGVTPTAPALSAVLAVGNTTGAHDILVTTGQKIDAETPGAGLNIGTVNATGTIQVGSTGNALSLPGNVTVGGDLTVNGTVTTINSTNLSVSDPLIYLNSGAASPSFAGVAIDQGGGINLDKLLLWNPTNTRFELGSFDTSGGTVVPASALVTLNDLRVNDLSLAGTSVTADAALTIAATGGTNDLSLTGRGATTTLNQSGQTSLDATFTGAGFTSIIGALNALVTGGVSASTTLQTAYNGGQSIVETGPLGPVVISNNVGNTSDTLQVNKSGGASGNGITVTMSGGAGGLAALFSGASISCPGAGANSERFGSGATATGVSSLAVGNAATAGALEATSVGFNASVSATAGSAFGYNAAANANAVAVGASSSAGNTSCVAVGDSANAPNVNGTAVGASSTASTNGTALGQGATNGGLANSIALGSGATNTSTNQLMIGSSASPISQVVIGNGATNATPQSVTIQTASSSTATVAGASLTLTPGTGNTTGAGGALALNGGTGGASSGTGGAASLTAGTGGAANGGGGLCSVSGGAASGSGTGGSLNLNGGTSPTGTGGAVVIQTGNAAVAQAVKVQPDGLTRIGTGTATSTLHVNGSLATKTTTITGDTTADVTTAIYLADATGGAITITLPLASTCQDRVYSVKKTDTSGNVVTIAAAGADTIDGQPTQAVSFAYESLTIVSDGANWWIV